MEADQTHLDTGTEILGTDKSVEVEMASNACTAVRMYGPNVHDRNYVISARDSEDEGLSNIDINCILKILVWENVEKEDRNISEDDTEEAVEDHHPWY